jgi:Antibiotic biosynthesis monooxygenase
VIKGSEAAFENVWLSRDSHLEKVPGFVEFHLLKGRGAEDHTLYASHTVWKSRSTFETLALTMTMSFTSQAFANKSAASPDARGMVGREVAALSPCERSSDARRS